MESVFIAQLRLFSVLFSVFCFRFGLLSAPYFTQSLRAHALFMAATANKHCLRVWLRNGDNVTLVDTRCFSQLQVLEDDNVDVFVDVENNAQRSDKIREHLAKLSRFTESSDAKRLIEHVDEETDTASESESPRKKRKAKREQATGTGNVASAVSTGSKTDKAQSAAQVVACANDQGTAEKYLLVSPHSDHQRASTSVTAPNASKAPSAKKGRSFLSATRKRSTTTATTDLATAHTVHKYTVVNTAYAVVISETDQKKYSMPLEVISRDGHLREPLVGERFLIRQVGGSDVKSRFTVTVTAVLRKGEFVKKDDIPKHIRHALPPMIKRN